MDEDLELYETPGIASRDAKVPLFLKWTYLFFPIWGFIWFVVYWNGSPGWLDPSSWRQLQIGANTTFPFMNRNMPQDPEWEAFEGEEEDLLQYD